MKAAQINGYGGQAVLRAVNTADKPVAANDQVLVEVHAAAVNPFDWKVREGLVRQMAELSFPATLGGDIAGTVAVIGAGVSGFETGQAVYGQANALGGQGSFAEFTPVKAAQLAAKPASISFTDAAALPLVAVSAYQALVDHMDLQPEQKILIHGGAGGVGSIAVQLAKYLGAYVATTTNATDIDFVKNLGADEVIDYQTQDFSTLLKDYDAVYDTVGSEINTKSYTILKPGGALVSMVEQPNQQLIDKYAIRYTAQFTRTTTERLTKVAELVDSGALKPVVDKIFPLDQAAKALEYLKTNHPRGKIVIQIKD
jgi:alcohol dehydrogenase